MENDGGSWSVGGPGFYITCFQEQCRDLQNFHVLEACQMSTQWWSTMLREYYYLYWSKNVILNKVPGTLQVKSACQRQWILPVMMTICTLALFIRRHSTNNKNFVHCLLWPHLGLIRTRLWIAGVDYCLYSKWIEDEAHNSNWICVQVGEPWSLDRSFLITFGLCPPGPLELTTKLCFTLAVNARNNLKPKELGIENQNVEHIVNPLDRIPHSSPRLPVWNLSCTAWVLHRPRYHVQYRERKWKRDDEHWPCKTCNDAPCAAIEIKSHEKILEAVDVHKARGDSGTHANEI